MPSTAEICSFTNSAVGEASAVGITVGMIVSAVEVGIAVGGIVVGNGVDLDSVAGIFVVVQAVRRNKETMMNFFMMAIICQCDRFALSGAVGAVEARQLIVLRLRCAPLRTKVFCYGVAPTKLSAYNASSYPG